MKAAPNRLVDFLAVEGSVSFRDVADLLRLCSRFRSRKSIADWCETLADELDRLEQEGSTQDMIFRANLQRNLNIGRSAAALLQQLARAPSHLHPRDELIEGIQTTSGALKVYICQIRASFDALGLADPLTNIWGEGYILSEDAALFVHRAARRMADRQTVGDKPPPSALTRQDAHDQIMFVVDGHTLASK